MYFDRLRRAGPLIAPIALLAFATQFAALDVLLRGGVRFGHGARAWLELCASVVVWSLFALASVRKPIRVLVAFAAGLILVVELIFYRYYHSFLDLDAAMAARHMWQDVWPVLRPVLARALPASLLIALIEYAWLSLALQSSRRFEWPRAQLGSGFAALFVLVFAIGAEARTPDLAAIGALRVLVLPKQAKAAGHVDLPKLRTHRTRIPNVLLIVTESVRASDYCMDSGPTCELAPETAALVPDRVPLRQMRSIASYTALTIQALLSGRLPSDSLEETVDTPLIFDYARAVRNGDQRPQALYWAAQSDSLFWRQDLRQMVDSCLTIDELFGRRIEHLEEIIDERADEHLAAEVERRMPSAQNPKFLLLHLSGTHVPYYVDEGNAPFKPYNRVISWANMGALHNAYKNSILAQDRSTARMLRSFFKAVGDEPWFVIFTSDHGESFGENNAIHHGQNLYDEQIHVPGFVAWGNAALEPREETALRAHSDDFVTHLDVVPTLLDALGVLDVFELEHERGRLAGRSLLRPFDGPGAPIPLTNCTGIFPCPLKNWGMLGQGSVLVAQPWDADFRCIDLLTHAPRELADPACNALRIASRARFDELPNGRKNR